MKQPLTPTQLRTATPLLTRNQLKEWLGVSDMWVRYRLDEPGFVDACVIDIATAGSTLRKLRFPASAVATYLGIPADATPQLASAA
ncbi:hypothetical protein ACFXGR_22230 [Streptomyces mirabilis]|uniref:hypothetical protein n=1 Tax=Streptomyces mirabilis TaxID=68239 RepID=UPI003681AADB